MYQLRYSKQALKQLHKLDMPTRIILIKWIEHNLLNCGNPYTIPQYKELKGNLSNYIRYRVGNYRIICTVFEQILTIEIVSVGHRKEVYRQK